MDADDLAHILDRANDLLEAGKPAETLRCLAQLERAELDGDDLIEATTLRAWALSEMGQYEAALDQLDRTLEEYPNTARLHAARGVVLSSADLLDEAQAELDYAHELEPDDGVTLANLALVYEKLRDYDRALELIDGALERGTEVDWALQRKAAVLTELGETNAAKGTLKRYLSLVPEDAAQWTALALLYSEDEDYNEAFQAYENAEQIEPDSAWLRLNWGITAVRAGRLDEAGRQLNALRELAPRGARQWLLTAFILEEERDMEAANAAYEAALEAMDPADPDDLSFTLEMAIDFNARIKQPEACDALLRRAYHHNACTVELCEAYREARGKEAESAMWYSVMIEGDYRTGLEEVFDPDLGRPQRPTRFLRNIQVVARDRDEAIATLLTFLRQMGEGHPRLREFVSDESIDDVFLGIYEVDRRSYILPDPDSEVDETP